MISSSLRCLPLTEFGQRIGYDPGQISRIENGKRPPTELFAQMCDEAFPDRDGWFGEFYASTPPTTGPSRAAHGRSCHHAPPPSRECGWRSSPTPKVTSSNFCTEGESKR